MKNIRERPRTLFSVMLSGKTRVSSLFRIMVYLLSLTADMLKADPGGACAAPYTSIIYQETCKKKRSPGSPGTQFFFSYSFSYSLYWKCYCVVLEVLF